MGKYNLLNSGNSLVELCGGGSRATSKLLCDGNNSIIIDIRPRQTYLAFHIVNSINLTTKSQILILYPIIIIMNIFYVAPALTMLKN